MIDINEKCVINPKPKVAESSSAERSFTLETDRDRSKTGANRVSGPCRTGKFVRQEIHQPNFWAKVEKSGLIPAHRPDLGPCWQWTAGRNSRGYGCFAIQGVSQLAHRVSVVLDGREIPDGLTVDHLCRNIVCVNPGHLEVVTLAENNRRQPIVQGNHCRRGHEFTPQNTIRKHGRRNCRICTRMKRVEWDATHPRTTRQRTGISKEGM